MKSLLLIAAACVVGYSVHRDYFAVPETSVVAPAPTPAPTPVPFAVRSAVSGLYEEWKRRELGDQRQTMLEPQKLFTDIKRALFSKGEHTDAAMRRLVVQTLGELGLSPDEREHVATGIMSLR